MFRKIKVSIQIGVYGSTTSRLTLTVLVTTIDAQWEGMGDVGSARYEPALLPPCPTIRVLSYSKLVNFQKFSTLRVKRSEVCFRCQLCCGSITAISRIVLPSSIKSAVGHVSDNAYCAKALFGMCTYEKILLFE